ncbi:Premnaspirodiene oxygenase [Platanthera zijinensis]|uniref:Premnaspirodiene oxygenase n=1 Tax=Platanthera zijinensis TaxID=2320716 RepID=A0AAP0FVT6_9ASPA
MESSVISIFSFLLFILSLILLLIKMLLWIQKNSGTPDNLPPGPRKLPIIGSMLHLIGEHPHRRLSRLAKTYGPLLHLKIGEVDLITISSPELAREIMKTHDVNFASRPQMVVGKIIFYNNSDIIFSPYGKYWWQLRKICAMNLLSPKRVKSFSFIREEETSNLVEQIRAAAHLGEPVNLSKLFFTVANSTVARAAFGKDCAHRESFFVAMKVIVKLGSGFNIADTFPSMGFLGEISGLRPRALRAHRHMDSILNEIIEEHRARRAEGDDEAEEDIVDVLLKIKDSGELDVPLTTDNIKAVILDLFMAGTETSSGFLDWVMSELIRHPKAMQKAQLEVRKAFNGRTKIEENETNELQYLNCVIKETLRLHPPAPLLVPRTCSESVKLSGYTIPARSRILINAGAIMKNPKYWENPESFCPERFQGSTLDLKGTNFEYFPFGSGRRICPGIAFALANIEEWLAQLLLNFDWRMPDGKTREDLDMEEVFGGTVTRKNNLYLLATPLK